MEEPGKQPPDFAATEFSVEIKDYVVKIVYTIFTPSEKNVYVVEPSCKIIL